MVAEPEAVVRLTRLRTELAADCAAMKARASEVAQLSDRWDKSGSLGRPELVLLAVNLHGWYTALETALEDRLRLAYLRYHGGVDTQLNALDADRDLYQAQLDLSRLRLQEVLSVVQLYKALGGGWQS